MNRLEHAVPAGIIMIAGLIVAYISFTQQPAEAFVFPRLISVVFVVLSVFVFMQTLTRGGSGRVAISGAIWRNILPGLVVAIIYIFWAAKGLGFYTASTIAFFILISIYDPAPHGQIQSWIKRAIITAGFLAIMYGLFAMLLGVFTPREVLF